MNNGNFSTNNQPNPAVQVATETAVFLPQPRSVSASEGIKWIGDSWEIVKQNPGKWILIGIIINVISTIIAAIPFLNLLNSVSILFFISGVIAICEHQRKTGKVNIGLLFIIFQQNFLTILGVFAILLVTIIPLLVLVSVGYAILTNLLSDFLPSFISDTILIVIIAVIMLLSIAMFWFAPPLIINHNYKAGAAILTSLKAVKNNILPGLLFFIVISILFAISVIPLGLGLLITSPVYLVCYYTAYRSIFFSASNTDQIHSAQTSFHQIIQNNRGKLVK